MPFIPAANTVQAEIRMTLDGQLVENVIYFRKASGWDVPGMTALGEAIVTWWDEELSLSLCGNLVLREVYLTDLTSATAAAVTVAAPTGTIGKVGDNPVPNNVALCVSFRTASRGRSGRGRNYVPAISEEQVNVNTVNEGVVAAIVAAYTALIDLAQSLDALWVVVSRFTGNAPRTTALILTILSVLVVDPIVDSQRRRLPGRGT